MRLDAAQPAWTAVAQDCTWVLSQADKSLLKQSLNNFAVPQRTFVTGDMLG